jgi:hypothetical protein
MRILMVMSVDQGKSVEWAQGKAREDRVHVVVSDEHGWVFVGIYDGFNGLDVSNPCKFLVQLNKV